MDELRLAPFASWAPLPSGLVVSLGSWYATATGPEAGMLRDDLLTSPAEGEEAVLSPAAAGSPLARRLAERGIFTSAAGTPSSLRELALARPEAEPPSGDHDSEIRGIGVHGAGPLADLTARLLSEELHGTAAPGFRPVRRTERAPDSADALSVLVVDQAPVDARSAEIGQTLADFNQRALRAGTPWLLLDGRAATPLTVGPLVVPGRTGCLECWWLRRAGFTRRPDAFRALLAGRRAGQLHGWARHAVAVVAVAMVATWARSGCRTGVAHEIAATRDGYRVLRHPYLPVAGCPACGGRQRRGRRPGGLRRTVVSALAGPVVKLTETGSDEVGWQAAARGMTMDTTHGSTLTVGGDGRAPTRHAARRRALAEFVERMTLSEPAPLPPAGGDRTLWTTDTRPAGETHDCPLEGAAVEVRDLATGERGLARASGFHLHPVGCALGTGPRRPSSSGAAAGDGLWTAIERGLFELLERDALMLAWRWDLPRPQWPYGDPAPAAGLRARYTDLSYLHGVPTIVCVVTGRGEGRVASAVGCATDRTPARAARRALGEAVAVHGWLRHDDVPDEAMTFTQFTDNARYYLHPDRCHLVDRLAPDGRAGRPADGAGPCLDGGSRQVAESVAARLLDQGIKVYAADLTPAWTRGTGLRVAVTRSPHLYPLELGPVTEPAAEMFRWRLPDGAGPAFLQPVPLA
ncbi:TOMM precursor leader peptide-binding protein [Phytohabitans kaempferiae]|uniref:TOMM leader peptide-binding protein n=1 Tax=Phytohabitans kaempferiae TaxID=1620943 RepID=A0ABV6M5R3_9ACTN